MAKPLPHSLRYNKGTYMYLLSMIVSCHLNPPPPYLRKTNRNENTPYLWEPVTVEPRYKEVGYNKTLLFFAGPSSLQYEEPWYNKVFHKDLVIMGSTVLFSFLFTRSTPFLGLSREFLYFFHGSLQMNYFDHPLYKKLLQNSSCIWWAAVQRNFEDFHVFANQTQRQSPFIQFPTLQMFSMHCAAANAQRNVYYLYHEVPARWLFVSVKDCETTSGLSGSLMAKLKNMQLKG